ncbi:MAG: amidohydrolase family protein, partial [Steroidobacter sp.]
MRFQTGILFACGLLFGTCAASQDVLIDNVTVVSPERDMPRDRAAVLIRNGRIVAIKRSPARRDSSQFVDGTGLYLTPGLIDSHVHLGDVSGMTPEQQQANPALTEAARAQTPRSYLYFGFTTLVDLLSVGERVKQWNAQAVRPDLYFCGGAPVMDGYPMNWTPKPERYKAWPYLLVQPGDIAPEGMNAADHTPEAVVKRMRADGAICVKSFFERGWGNINPLPVPTRDTIDALVRAAHKERMPVFL